KIIFLPGSHTLQRVGGCELNIETKAFKGFLKYGYDGEDFLEFDLNGLKWIALRKEAVFLKLLWDTDTQDLEFHHYLLTDLCYGAFNASLVSGQSSLFKTGTVLQMYFKCININLMFLSLSLSGVRSKIMFSIILKFYESSQIRITVIAVVSAVMSIIIIALAFTAYKKRNGKSILKLD
uniref:MHC class I-like antigen recognition-like domain-containing protein n=1 Tax=Poecilia reticulata TaxID=8081 RepID=A0A3P9NL72_POERE